MSHPVRRGDVFWANLDPTTNIAHLSPSHVLIPAGEGGLIQDSKALTEQIRAMDKKRLTTKIGALSERFLRLIEQGIRNSLDM